MVWLQLYNLSIELWDGYSLETLTGPIGKLLKVNEITITLAKAKYARVCLEINLAQPLKRGFWIEDGETMIFVMILYKCLPTFCLHYSFIGHGANNCSCRLEKSQEDVLMEDPSFKDASSKDSNSNSGTSTIKKVASVTPDATAPREVNEDPQDSEFGSCMLATGSKEHRVGPWWHRFSNSSWRSCGSCDKHQTRRLQFDR